MTSTANPMAAVVTGARQSGATLTAKLPDGVVGTLQFTTTSSAGIKTNIVGAVAYNVNSLSYTIQSSDNPKRLGCDASAQVATDTKNHSFNTAPAGIILQGVVGTAAASNADGMPDNTLYVQSPV